jgi:hypothetical protein
MKKCKYYVGCYGFEGMSSGFKTMRVVTKINQNGAPLFEMNVTPLEFTSAEADAYMRKLIDEGFVAVTIRIPHDRPFMCRN